MTKVRVAVESKVARQALYETLGPKRNMTLETLFGAARDDEQLSASG